MAILFDDAASESLVVDSTPITAAPFTMACWFNSDSDALDQSLMWVGDKDVGNQYWSLEAGGNTSGDPVRLLLNNDAGSIAASSSGYSVNTWHHACGVFASATSRSAYIDGGSKGTDADSYAPSNADRIGLGARRDSTPTIYLSGMLAEAAIWNVALADAEVALLGLGFSPLFIRPESLVFYLPMFALGVGNAQNDWIGGRVLTEDNTPANAVHPPKIIYPPWIWGGDMKALSVGVIAASLAMTGAMTALPLSAEYPIYASNVPKNTFVSRT